MTAKRFRFPSERPGIDLLATVGARGTDSKLEKLRSPDDLATWLVEAGLTALRPPDLTEDDLSAVGELREAVYRIARARLGSPVGGVTAADIALINRAAAVPPLVTELSADATALIYRTPERSVRAVEPFLATIARDAIDILGSPSAAKLKTCANPVCQAVFLDLSRPGLRRWCSMGEGGCGNRAKTAALRDRRRRES